MAKIKTKRLFTAFCLESDVKKFILNNTKRLKLEECGVRLVRPETLHITLHFFGDIDKSQEKVIETALLDSSKKSGPVEFVINDVSAFPGLDSPRVVIVKADQIGGGDVVNFQKTLGYQLKQNKINIDNKPWHPHVTLGRVKRPGMVLPKDLLIGKKQFTIKSYKLIESKLGHDGARHNTIRSYEL